MQSASWFGKTPFSICGRMLFRRYRSTILSRLTVEPPRRRLRRLGASSVEWVPLAGDVEMHKVSAPREEWRCRRRIHWAAETEREVALASVIHGLPEARVMIWGADWRRRSRHAEVIACWQKRPVYGGEFAAAVASCKVNLNIIDQTNYPAANMRFFEIPCAGGLQLCSSCPEMEDTFQHGQHLIYFEDYGNLPRVLKPLLENAESRARIAASGHSLVTRAHTYSSRAGRILEVLGLRR